MNGDLVWAYPGAPKPGAGAGEFGVMVRSIGDARLGAVRVIGGAENVMLPRLPIELPPPRRASAMAGASSRAATATTARKREPRPNILRVTLFM
jgi:hypothetical protein